MTNIIGSFVPAEQSDLHTFRFNVLTIQGIMSRHKLELDEVEQIKSELYKMALTDIFFAYPDGPYYDIALYMLATSR